MAVKTITIDMEAYNLLASHKREGQSFSQVIKAHFGGPMTAGRFRERLRTMRPLSPDTIAAIEAQIKARKNHPARVIKW